MGKRKNNEPFYERLKFLDQFGTPAIFSIEGKESFGTFIGVLWSIVFLVALLISIIFYGKVYSLKEQPTVQTSLLTNAEVEQINLANSKFFVSLQFREEGQFIESSSYTNTWFRFKAFLISETQESEVSEIVPEVTRTELEIVDCSEDSSIDKTQFSGRVQEALQKGSSCIIFNNNEVLTGDHNSLIFKYIDIEVLPCDEDLPSCKTGGLSEGVNLGNTVADEANEKVRKVSVEVNFVEAAGNDESFNNPVNLHINSNYKFSMDLYMEQFVDIYMMPLTVDSVYGEFWDSQSSASSLTLSQVIQDSTTRDPGTKTFSKQGQDDSRSANYLNIRILGSNKSLTMTREYKKLIDVFSDVGGLAEVISFVIALFYGWYNGVKMETYQVNKGVLQSDHINDELHREELQNRRPFYFCEIFCFAYLGFCFKRSPRFKLYEASLERVEERTDFLTFIQTQGNNLSMIDSLFEPYQRKLIQFVKIDAQKMDAKVDGMTLDKALDSLGDQKAKGQMQQAIDNWLSKNIDLDIKNDTPFKVKKTMKNNSKGGTKFNQIEPSHDKIELEQIK